MANTASAEEMDAFYLCPGAPEKPEIEVRDRIQIAHIIHEIAVALGKIRVKGLYVDQDLICEGMWSGKTILDWNKERFRMKIVKAT